jgi:YHS domain-containing protein
MTVSNLRHRRGSGATDGATLRCALLVAACLLAGFLVDARAAVASAADLPALDGLDPVRLVEGMEEQGDPLLTATHEGLVYRFASDRTRRAFLAEPERYAVQLAGACARMGPGVEGAPDLFAVHDGRLYLFGTEQCLEAFVEHPERYLLPELPPLEPTTAELKAARELLAKAISALGERPLRRGGGYRVAGTIERGSNAAPFEIWTSTSGAVRREGRDGPVSLVEVWDGRTGRVRRQGGAAPLSATRREALVQEARLLDALTVLRGVDPKKAIARVEEPDAPGPTRLVRFAGVAADSGAGDPVVLEIDRHSGRVVSLRFRGRGPGGIAGWISRRFDDFRPAGDLFLPFRRSDTFEDHAEPFRVTVVESLAVVDGFDPGLFAIPDEPPAAALQAAPGGGRMVSGGARRLRAVR